MHATPHSRSVDVTTSPIGRIAAIVLAVLGFAAGTAAQAVAQRPTIRVDPSSVRPGKVVVIDGYVPACGGTILLLSRAFKRGGGEHAGVQGVTAAVRESDGYYRKRTRIPRNRRAGTYRVSGRCGGGNVGGVNLRVLRR